MGNYCKGDVPDDRSEMTIDRSNSMHNFEDTFSEATGKGTNTSIKRAARTGSSLSGAIDTINHDVAADFNLSPEKRNARRTLDGEMNPATEGLRGCQEDDSASSL